jgi:Fic family protein
LIDFAAANFEGKEHSTLKAKCRSVWNYYEQRNWTIPTPYTKKDKGEVMATRLEHIEQVNKNRIIKNQNKIKAILDDIFLQDDIKFKNGKYRVGKIAELAKVHRETVAKYLKEMELI